MHEMIEMQPCRKPLLQSGHVKPYCHVAVDLATMIGEVLYKPGSRHIKTMGAWRGVV